MSPIDILTADPQPQWRDRWTAVLLVVGCWVLFGAVEQRPFTLQGAVVEALVERGRMYFIRGEMSGDRFVNLDTNTPSFRYLFNIFPHERVYRVNHAPGQFLLAAPWYAACVKLGWRFETDERLVWRLLVWTLTAPLAALAVACLFLLGRAWALSWSEALLASIALGFCSPWWPAAGVLYHDGMGVALILIGVTLSQRATQNSGASAATALIASGAMLAVAVVTTYLVAPIVLGIVGAVLWFRPPIRNSILLAVGFLPVLAILPVINLLTYGTIMATGYSVGGFYENYPAPLNLINAWEKTSFYLWSWEYGLAGLFPVFLLGLFGLCFKGPLPRLIRLQVIILAAIHFLYIVTMQHHGSVGWGMGRFFLPLYPLLALGLPALWALATWKGAVARVVLMAAMAYSFVFALAGAWYGVQGVMEPGFPSLKLRVAIDHFALYQVLSPLAIVVGMVGEILYQAYSGKKSASAGVPIAGREPHVRKPSTAAEGLRPRRRRK
jgi:hypothetical protein